MKPLRIVIRNFGPYADEQIVDFTLLGDNGLFLIHGPTGAGKSSILDALCFSLYGDTSGQERSSKDMRSDFCDPLKPTEVIFDFMLRDKSYRVFRAVEYEKPGKKEGEKTTVPAKANLWERTGIDCVNDDGAVIAGKCRAVTEKIENLLGLRIDQFRQVVILPQGEFRKFLLATSTEKEKILEILFNTEFYRKVQEALKEEAGVIEKQAEKLKDQRKNLLNQYSAETDENIKDMSIDVYRKLMELHGKLQKSDEEEKSVTKELERAQEIQNKFNELNESERIFQKLSSKKGDMETYAEKLLKARKALPVRELEKNLTEKHDDYEKSVIDLEKSEKEFEKSEEVLKKAIKILEEEKNKDKERDSLIGEIDRLKSYPEKVEMLEEAVEKSERVKKEIEAKEESLEKEKKAIEKIKIDLEKSKKDRVTLKEKASGLEAAELKLKEAERKLSVIKEIFSIEPEAGRYRDNYEKERVHLENLEKEKEEKRKKKEEVEYTWITGQAAVIACKLIPGSPCPVCGSPEHPSPAVMEEGSVPSENILKKAGKDLKDIEGKCEKSREDLNEFHNKYDALSVLLEEKKKSLGILKDKSLSFFQKEFSMSLKEKEDIEKAKESLPDMEKNILYMEKKIEEMVTGIEKSVEFLQKKREKKAEEEKTVQLMEKEIPDDLRNIKKLNEKISGKDKELARLKENLEKAEKNHSQIKANLEGKKQSMKIAGNYKEEAERKYEKSKKSFEEKVLSEGFISKEDYLLCCLSSDEINRIDGELQHYRKEFHAARERYKRASDDTEGLEKQDVCNIQNTLERIKKELKDSVEEKGRMTERASNLDDAIKKLKELSAESEKLEKNYSITGRMAEVAGGKNAWRITFQRYVLASLLDDIIIAANQRLTLMSNKRYGLRRATERKDQRRSGGLDLMVNDEYTGMERSVSTLSGGESFLASLSLALGLADVVQSYAGGIRLDTIFVDEGFGSLDPEALDLAFRALADLQKGGRLVGIISHVPELGERISSRLEVTPTRKGSRARFVV